MSIMFTSVYSCVTMMCTDVHCCVTKMLTDVYGCVTRCLQMCMAVLPWCLQMRMAVWPWCLQMCTAVWPWCLQMCMVMWPDVYRCIWLCGCVARWPRGLGDGIGLKFGTSPSERSERGERYIGSWWTTTHPWVGWAQQPWLAASLGEGQLRIETHACQVCWTGLTCD